MTSIKASKDILEINTLTLCGNTLTTTLRSSNLIPVHNQPFANWRIKGTSLTMHPWKFPVRQRLKFYVHSNLEDLSSQMKDLIDKIEFSDQKDNATFNSLDADWDAKIAQLKIKSK